MYFRIASCPKTVSATRLPVVPACRSIGTLHQELTPISFTSGELEHIQFLLGHVSVQTTERYAGCTQRILSAVNDRIGIEPGA